jgi:hypothetical protein
VLAPRPAPARPGPPRPAPARPRSFDVRDTGGGGATGSRGPPTSGIPVVAVLRTKDRPARPSGGPARARIERDRAGTCGIERDRAGTCGRRRPPAGSRPPRARTIVRSSGGAGTPDHQRAQATIRPLAPVFRNDARARRRYHRWGRCCTPRRQSRHSGAPRRPTPRPGVGQGTRTAVASSVPAARRRSASGPAASGSTSVSVRTGISAASASSSRASRRV